MLSLADLPAPAPLTLAPELVVSFRRLLAATQRGKALAKQESRFTAALAAADAEAVDLIHGYINSLYAHGRNEGVQGLVNAVESELARYVLEMQQ
jgi:hypothetical protein